MFQTTNQIYITLQHITVQYMTLLLYLYLAKRCQMAVKHPNMWWIDGRLVAWGSVDPLWKRTAFSGNSVYPVCIQNKSQKTWIEFLEFRISKRGLWKQALTLTPPQKNDCWETVQAPEGPLLPVFNREAYGPMLAAMQAGMLQLI